MRDLGDELRGLRSARVTVSTPAEAVPLPADTAREIGDAVRAALHNVEQHAGDGAHAWVLLETLDDTVLVTVRDDGVGFAPDGWRRRPTRAGSGSHGRCGAGWPSSAAGAPSSRHRAGAPRSRWRSRVP